MENPTYHQAQRQVERKIAFFIHLGVYSLVNTALVIANLLSGSGRIWFIAPLLGWGIGLLFHGTGVFLRASKAKWKQRMIENELKKQRRQLQA